MLEIASQILPVVSDIGAMLAAPILAVAFLVAVGRGALDDAIVGVPDHLIRWWQQIFREQQQILLYAGGTKAVRDGMRGRKIIRKPSSPEPTFEQVEMKARKEQKPLAEQAAVTLSSKPSRTSSSRSPPTSSPRVVGTRRRRSRGNSCDVEMRPF